MRALLLSVLLAVACSSPKPNFVRATQVVDAALARGVWTREDRDQLRALFVGLSTDETQGLIHRVLPAINEGRMRIEGLELHAI